MNLKKRTMDEMITHFNDVVSKMNISRKDKMTLLGMITAIGYEAQNAADVAPVVHGCWIDGLEIPEEERKKHPYVYLHGEKHCSVCYHEAYFDTDYGQQLFDYCPNCGARMDAEEREKRIRKTYIDVGSCRGWIVEGGLDKDGDGE